MHEATDLQGRSSLRKEAPGLLFLLFTTEVTPVWHALGLHHTPSPSRLQWIGKLKGKVTMGGQYRGYMNKEGKVTQGTG